MSAAAQEKIDAVQDGAESWSAEEVARWAFAEFHPHAAIASSFGAEDVALIDIAARVRPDIRVFTLDTDFLFAETYELIDKIEQKYGIRVERVKSLYTPWNCRPPSLRPSFGPSIRTSAARCAKSSRRKPSWRACPRGSREFAATRRRHAPTPKKSNGTNRLAW